jgi:putative DNA primase/helicase
MSKLAERCRGRWPGILMALGVLDQKALRHKDVPCPTCGGRDRFRYTDKGYGRWYCRGCRVGGDGVALVEHVMGVDFAEAARLIDSVIGAARYRPEVGGDHRNADPLKAWREASPSIRSTAGAAYLTGRCGLGKLTDAEVASLRFHPALWHWPTQMRWPAIVALVRLHDGAELCAHQTFIKPDGSDKAPVEKPRLFPKGGKTEGAGVWFGTPEEQREFLVGEGIESTLSAIRIYSAASGSAALSADGVSKLILPSEAGWVRIFADHDPDAKGLAAAVEARLRWQAEGRQVTISHAKNVGEDTNDLWRRRIEGRANV